MVKRGKSDRKPHSKRISKGKKGKPLRKRQEIKREQIRKRALMRKMKYITTLAVLVTIVAIAIIFYPSSPDEDNVSNNNHPNGNNGDNIGIEVGQTAPNFELTDTDSNKFNLAEYRGNIVVIDFMATWCNPCVQEMDELKKVRSDYYNKGVRIMSIDVDDEETTEDLSEFKTDHGCDWLFAAYGGSVAEAYGVQSIPMIYIIDGQGVITYKDVGVTDYSTLSYELDKLV